MNKLIDDLKFAARLYAKNKTVTVVSLLALAIGVAAVVVCFAVVNSVLLHPLPYPDSDRMVQVYKKMKDGPANLMPYARFRFLQANNRTFDSLAAYDVVDSGVTMVRDGIPQLIQNVGVTSDFFKVVGVHPILGRDFSVAEDQAGVAPVAVISYKLWTNSFDQDPHILGRVMSLSGENYTIVGVMPEGFAFAPVADVWAPLRNREDWTDHSSRYLVTGRLKSGVSTEQAQQDLDRLEQSLKEQHSDIVPPTELAVSTIPYKERVVGNIRSSLVILIAAAFCILLIACADVANLLLSRALVRRKEIAIRSVLGVSRFRMIRQLLTESVLLGGLGGALGLGLAIVGVRLIVHSAPDELPAVTHISIDLKVVLFAIAISLLTGIIFGLAPALQLSSTSHIATLRDGEYSTPGRKSRRVQNGLVSFEIALSTLLLTTASLLLLSFQNLRKVDLGFQPQHVLTVQTSFASKALQNAAAANADVQRILLNITSIPGVRSAAAITRLPTEASLEFPFDLLPKGTTGDEGSEANWKAITPDLFNALQISLRSGRLFTDTDGMAGAKVAIINEAFAKQFLGTQSPNGTQLLIGRKMGGNFLDTSRQIVGVVTNTRDDDLSADPQPTMYIPLSQVPDGTMSALNKVIPLSWIIRTEGNPMSFTKAVGQGVFNADSTLAASKPRSLEQVLGESIARQRMQTTMVTVFAAVALFLAVVGLYGIVVHAVTERRHEVAIRFALGATEKQVLKLMISYGLILVIPGVVLGLFSSLLLRPALASFLFAIHGVDLTAYLFVAVLLVAVSILATIIPSLRLRKIDPARALRE